jgi:NAD(P)-dependent dehydrogenase (short-subunit alcohol dehydrogenase family)
LRLRAFVADGGSVSLSLADGNGDSFAEVKGLLARFIDAEDLRRAEIADDGLLRLEWVDVAAASGAGLGRLAVLGGLELPGVNAERFPDLAAAAAAASPPDLVLADCSALGAGAELPSAAARGNATQALDLLKHWIAEERLANARLVVLTRGAVAVDGSESPDLTTAPLWGLLRSAQAEHPGSFVLVDVDDSERSAQQLSAALLSSVEEPQIAIRQGRTLAPRLARLVASNHEVARRPLDSQSTALISGGFADLGALLARHLAEEEGVRHLLFACAEEEMTAAGEVKDLLEAIGCEVRVELCDTADREQLQTLLDSIPEAHPLGAVVHATRVLDDGVLESLDPERLERTMRPKADAAWHLHELTEGVELSRFLLVSSAAGLLGAAAQANYAAANSFLDALAAYRRARGLPATSMSWGWADLGEGVLGEAARARIARAGLVPISAQRGLDLLGAASSVDEPLLALVELDPAILRAQAREGTLPALLRGLVPTRAQRRGRRASLAERLAAVPSEQRSALALETVRSQIAAVLGHRSGQEVEPERPFQELGFDSLSAVELRNRLATASGLRLPPTLAFDYPTPAALAGYLAERCDPESSGRSRESEVEVALTALEIALAALDEDRGARGRVIARLRAALAGLSSGGPAPPEVGVEDLAAMSHDEVFALIDEEVGDD